MRKVGKKLTVGTTYVGPEAIGIFKVLEKFKDGHKESKVIILKRNSSAEEERFEDILAGCSKEIEEVAQFDTSAMNAKYAFTLGYLSKNAIIIADIPHTRVESFDKDYLEIKNKNPNRESKEYSVHRCGKTWAYSIRVFFPMAKDLEESNLILPKSVINNTSNHDKFSKRVSDNKWARKLMAMGFDLGNEHDYELIKSNIPDEYKENFDKGFNN